jgi:hydroxypyruvate isomerase
MGYVRGGDLGARTAPNRLEDHDGGVPGRHELNDTQEVNWVAVMKAIAATSYGGYVAHEFRPTGDPLESLRQAVDLCDV